MAHNREQFRALILELINDVDEAREEEILEQLNKLSPSTNIEDILFHSDDFYGLDLNIDGLLDKVFSDDLAHH